MAIVKMKRLTLLAMTADKDKIYNALISSHVVQLKRSEEISGCVTENPSQTMEALLEKSGRAEEAIRYLAELTAVYNSENKKNKSAKVQIPKNSLARPLTEIGYDYFLSFGKNVEKIERDLDTLAELKSKIAEIENRRAQNRAEYAKLLPYKDLPHPTSWYKDTESSFVQLSQIPTSELENVRKLCAEYDMADVEQVCGNSSVSAVVVVVHKSQAEFLEKAMAYGLTKAAVRCEVLPKLVLKDMDLELSQLNKELAEIKKQIVSYDKDVPEWKIYIDYVNLCVKKAEADGDLQQTHATFVLEGYYPAEKEERVEKAISKVSDSLVLTFDEIGEDEFAPTLTKNNGLVKQFEFVTNMYTPPSYHEIDPNPVMSVFYFIIFGFMVADVGYGLILVLAGLLANVLIRQRSAVRTLLQMFGLCGVSAVVVGAIFGSYFSYQLYDGIIPDPSKYPMVMMIISLFVGIAHICAGIGCRMAIKIKHKQTLSAWLVDFTWIVVFVFFVLAVFNAALDMANYPPYEVLRLPQIVSDISLYICLAALAVSVISAGLDSKGFLAKASKSFGSLYSIINYFSDIMSYIRIFGLMLSSMLMGSVVNQLGGMVAGNGGIGYVFAALVLVFAHLFNLVMGVLSVYIHNGRLAYVEFFSRFYTGDGMLFVPFGSDTKYTLLKRTVHEEKVSK